MLPRPMAALWHRFETVGGDGVEMSNSVQSAQRQSALAGPRPFEEVERFRSVRFLRSIARRVKEGSALGSSGRRRGGSR